MMLQEPVPPVPPHPPIPFDPNLVFQSDEPAAWLIALVVLAALTAATIILFPIMRAFARRLESKAAGDSSLRSDVEQLHARLGDVDTLHARVLELEERVDFAERLLAQGPQSARLGARTDEGG